MASQTDRSAPAPSNRMKMALLTWVGAYATITLILVVLGPVMEGWPLPLKTLILSLLMVAALTWVVIPRLLATCRRWRSAG